jgi:hypothetical protein
MDIDETRGHGHHLAIAAAIRVLATRVAQLADPQHPDQWFTALGQEVFDYVDHTKHPQFKGEALRGIKEAAYNTLRMMFDQ